MSQQKRCPNCNTPLADDGPMGLCAACLLAEGKQTDPQVTTPYGLGGPSQEAATEAPTPRDISSDWTEAPQPKDLAAFFPNLEIVELLGQGGMGAVYKARQPKLNRIVALKILPPKFSQDPSFAERFAREAQALAKLNHPSIVTLFDFGDVEGIFYFIMEYVDGVNLRQMLRDGKLAPEQALAIVPQVCDALQFAHDEGVVHRDIKPENILIDKRGRVKIADFGLARLFDQQAEQMRLTYSQQVMGTPHYMAPEQVKDPLKVDHRADIYSLGVVFYELLTGDLPIGRFDPPSVVSSVDAGLDEVVMRTLEREVDRRYQKVSEVKTGIETARSGVDIPIPPKSPLPHRVPVDAPVKPAQESMDIASARGVVRGPAIGLIIVGLIDLAPLLLAALMMVSTVRKVESAGLASIAPIAIESTQSAPSVESWAAAEESESRPPSFTFLGIGELLIVGVFIIPVPIIILIGGMRMLKLDSHGLALIASILAMLPCHVGFVVGLPIGVWSLIVLNKPEIKAAFDRVT